MSESYPVVEGEVIFEAPIAGKPCKTWYKVVGNLDSPPLIALHGGPGTGHQYLSPLIDLYTQYNIPIVFYDQIGCGNSTHLREKMGDDSFWTFELFYQQLDNLISHLKLSEYYLLGQSWGGMLASAYAARHPKGLRKVILASGPASVPTWQKEANRLVSELPPETRKTLEDCVRNRDFESPEYEKAYGVFLGRHVCRLNPWPDPVQASFENLNSDMTAYLTMQGPSEFVITGSFKDWEGWKFGHEIEVETLLLNGKYDEMTHACIEPWFRTIPKVKWVTLENSSHMGHFEDRQRYMKLCGSFLSSTRP
ncbi:proline-specific peptidase [Hypoxylon rubiginosum]|uniref:Proline-specific peptidase n=1 Tax=Hypoxylon rubiginosum TaxID=110542 RepID=A0ACC0D7N5_9PEZI|nr:proline-specific peptidase [Hypoxylon rubiginosum]